MSAPELRRGRIVYALFPFTTEFPLESPDGEIYPTVADFAEAHGGRPARFVVEARLRPVLLLHDATRGNRGDIVCLRVNSVKPRHEQQRETWRRIVERRHRMFFHLPAAVQRYGLRRDSLIAIGSIGLVSKGAVFGSPVGALNEDEMQEISERLVRALQLDVSPMIAARARELLRRAGLLNGPPPRGAEA